MNPAQAHLMLNHLPVIGVLFAAFALGVGLTWKSGAILRLGLAALVIAGLAAVPAFLSGEPAEEKVEHLAGITESAIEPHEDFAKVAFVGMDVVALFALVALLLSLRRPPSRGLAAVALVAALAMGGVFAWTAHLGGQIRHPELAGSMASAGDTEPAGAGEAADQEEEDDD